MLVPALPLSLRRLVLAAVLVLALAGAGFATYQLTHPSPAHAATREYVRNCDSVVVRSSPGGPAITTLIRNQWMDITQSTGTYHYGQNSTGYAGWALASCFGF